MIEPDIDLYGTHARDSALADFLEIQSVAHGRSLSRDQLADYITDNDWTLKGRDLVDGPDLDPDPHELYGEDVYPDEEEASAAVANRVFLLLQERAHTLGVAHYPFRVSSDGVVYRGGNSIECKYGFLLAAAFGYAHRITFNTANPTILLEDFTSRSLSTLGCLVANIGDYRRSGSFDDRVLRGGRGIHLKPSPDQAFRSSLANDEKVDVVGHLWLKDLRPGRWVMVGQVTCGRSENWYNKMREPSAPQWQKLLGLLIRPMPFLAVPHHVPPRRFSYLVENAEGVLLDRIRLTHFGAPITSKELSVIQTVCAEQIER